MTGSLYTERHAMENTFYTWLTTMNSGAGTEYRATVVTENRNASALYDQEAAVNVYPSILRVMKWNRARSVNVVASCGCMYRFEKFEDYVGYTCDRHFVQFMMNGDDDE